MNATDLEKGITPLSAEEQEELAIHEVIIAEGIATFWDVGRSLFTVREKRLYRGTHETFEAYCRARWDISRQHAYRLIEATDVFENVSPVGVIFNERQARALAHYEKDVQRTVLQIAQKTAPTAADGAPAVTASHLKAVGEVLTGILEAGGLDDGSEVKPLGVLIDAAVTEEVYERILRQKEYIRQAADKKLRARSRSDVLNTDQTTSAIPKTSHDTQAKEAQQPDTPQQSAARLWTIIRDLVSEIDYWRDESGIKIRAQSFDAYEIAKSLIGEPPEGRELLIDNYIRTGKCEKCGADGTNIRDIHITSQWANKIGTVRFAVCDECLPGYEVAANTRITDKRIRA